MSQEKLTLLIVDDSEMNRAILSNMLEESYNIIEAVNGKEALEILESRRSSLSLMLLDIVMPELDGFGVLEAMRERGWVEELPVIMISSETDPAIINRAYDMGVTDFISRPFDISIVHHRVVNTILLYTKQRKLTSLVIAQVRANTKQSTLMTDILSHVVEFRNGESGLHVIHIRLLTNYILHCLMDSHLELGLTEQEIALISLASALHDVGKIAIPRAVLNKPGRLTDEEFEIIKTHSAIGSDMLKSLSVYHDEPLVREAQAICRWHHERWNGLGYPDGLKGDEIPLSAQVVALADVYDALTSKRVYKPALSHKDAKNMILNGECGAFNPMLLECLEKYGDDIPEILTTYTDPAAMDDSPEQMAAELLKVETMLTAALN